MRNKKTTLCFLVGDGYLGSSIEVYLHDFFDAVIKYEHHKHKTFKHLLNEIKHLKKSKLFDEITLIYAAAPNKKTELTDLYKSGIFINGIKKEYNKIKKLFKKLIKYNIKIVYFNTSSIFYQNQFQNDNVQYQYIKCNEKISKIKNIYQLYLPYIYSNDLITKKPDSLYSKIKKGLKINPSDHHLKIPIMIKEMFITSTMEKLKSIKLLNSSIFNRVHSKYNSIDIELIEFQNKIISNTI